jgi:hypothetical protein
MEYASFAEMSENYIFMKRIIEGLSDDHFEFMSEKEARKAREEIIYELSIDASFKHLAMFEARLRTDYNLVLSTQKKDALSREYMKLCREHRTKLNDYNTPLEKLCRRVKFDHLLDVVHKFLKQSGKPIHRDCSALKGYLKFRHWYAHGRYFRHIPSVPDPEDLEYVCDEIISAVENRVGVMELISNKEEL